MIADCRRECAGNDHQQSREGHVTGNGSISTPLRIFFGFAAGFVATLVFHQLMLALLWGSGMVSAAPFGMAPTRPLHVPAVISLSFWGGVWGIIFAFVERFFPRRGAYWIVAILFGAIFPSLFALFMVFPLKGMPMAGGWKPVWFLVACLVNGAWGWGTAIFLRAFVAWSTVSGSN
jgi:hypothetical protein